jgi:hypothetical protein
VVVSNVTERTAATVPSFRYSGGYAASRHRRLSRRRYSLGYPFQIAGVPLFDGEDDDLRYFVGVELTNPATQLCTGSGGRLQVAVPFVGLFNLSLPPVGTRDWANYLGTGCQALFDKPPPQSLSGGFVGQCGTHLHAFSHSKYSMAWKAVSGPPV